jgi:hypothetical protein
MRGCLTALGPPLVQEVIREYDIPFWSERWSTLRIKNTREVNEGAGHTSQPLVQWMAKMTLPYFLIVSPQRCIFF